MSSASGRTAIEPKLYLFLSILRTLNKIKLMLCALFNYNKGDKTKRLSMNVAFKYIWPKWLNCFPMEGLSIYIMYHSLHDYDYHPLGIMCVTF